MMESVKSLNFDEGFSQSGGEGGGGECGGGGERAPPPPPPVFYAHDAHY